MLSLTKLVIIAVIVFAVFGAGKLPKVMGDLGRGIRALKDGMNGDDVVTGAAPPAAAPHPSEIARIESARVELPGEVDSAPLPRTESDRRA